MVNDELVERCLHSLRDGDSIKRRAADRAAKNYAEQNIKVVFSKCYLASKAKTSAEREAEARVSPEYLDALEMYREAIRKDEINREVVNAAQNVIDMYRTIQASNRRGF